MTFKQAFLFIMLLLFRLLFITFFIGIFVLHVRTSISMFLMLQYFSIPIIILCSVYWVWFIGNGLNEAIKIDDALLMELW